VLTSTGSSWSSMSSSAQLATNLKGGTSNSFISPGVVQLEDGSLRAWLITGSTERFETMYRSDDGLTWTKVGDCTSHLPVNMWGPYHLDVIRAGGAYWMAGSFNIRWVDGSAQGHGSRIMYLTRSDDGLIWEPLLPAGLQPGLPGTWNEMGGYRPSMLWLGEGQGMEWYVGHNDNDVLGINGGTGRYVDPTWSPTTPRILTEPIGCVFWGPAREFTDNYGAWPLPLQRVVDSSNDGSVAMADGALVLTADGITPRAKARAHGYRPRDFEFFIRCRVTGNDGMFPWGTGADGIWLDSSQRQNIQLRHGGATVLQKTAAPTPSEYHVYRQQRIGNTSRAWVDAAALDATGDGTGITQAYTSGRTELESLGPQVMQWPPGGDAVTHVDWFFFRDAIPNEPSYTIGQALNPGSMDSYFRLFEVCATGPGIRYGPTNLPSTCTLPPDTNGILAVDMDRDGDVDMDDFGILQRCMGSTTQTADHECAGTIAAP
jgi:hypothetical protein